MYRTRMSLASAVVCGFASSVVAQDLPQPSNLAQHVERVLPAWWSVDELRVVASERQGGVATPRALVRFEADASPESDLFSPIGSRAGPFQLVVRTKGSNDSRTLYGIVDLSYQAGEWSGEALIENPVADLGLPADAFTMPVIEAGSPETEERLAALRASLESAAEADLAARIEEIEASNSREIARREQAAQEALRRLEAEHREREAALVAAHEERLARAESRRAEVEAEHAARLADSEADLASAIEEYEAQLASAIAELEEAHQSELRQLRANHGESLAGLRDSHADVVAELQAEQEAELQSLRSAHATAVAELRARNDAEIAGLEAGFAAEIEATRRRTEEAKELQELQAELAEATERVVAGGALLAGLDAELIEKRRTDLESLLGEWTGFNDCSRDRSGRRVAFHATEVVGVNLEGAYQEEGRGPQDAALSTSEPAMTLPASLTLSIVGPEHALFAKSGMVLTLGESGRLVYRQEDCNFVMSR